MTRFTTGRDSSLATKTLPSHVALLRGINVGGKNKLPMKDLVAIFVAAGCVDVQTYIQSGNVVFSAPTAVAKRLPSNVAAAIRDLAGYRIPVVMRTVAELESVSQNNPFLKTGREPDTLHVAFLLDLPKPSHVAAIDLKRSPPDELVVRGRDIYLRLPNGVAPSKLTTAYFDATLGTTSTLRNWRTVLKLLEVAGR
jgi:uncharacterized protein (DUF1697 family)